MTIEEQKEFAAMKAALQQARQALATCESWEAEGENDGYECFDEEKVKAALSTVIRILEK